MKTRKTYGSYRLRPEKTAQLQWDWHMVEQPSSQPRFLNFPCCDLPVRQPVTLARRRATEKRPLAA